MKIGVYGGSFDPPHHGHLAFAHAAIKHLELDEVQFVPNSRNPIKPKPSSASGKHRMEMVRLLIDDLPHLAVCDIEIQKGGNSFTVETMTELTFAQAGEFWFLVGTDALFEIEKWKHPERLLKMCRLGVTLRAPHTESDILARAPEFAKPYIDFIPMDVHDVSSTEIRERIADGRPVAKFLPAPVLGYIEEKKLYKTQ